MYNRTLTIFLLISIVVFTYANTVMGKNPVGLFLLEDFGARPSGLGGAFGAACGDVNSIRYNPSGLSEIKQWEFSLSHHMSFENITYESLLLGIPLLKHKAALGLNIDFANYGDIEKTDGQGDVLGSFTAKDSVINLSFAKKLGLNFMIGCNVKFLNFQMEDAKTSAVAGDIGCIYKIKNLRFGITVQNFGNKVTYFNDEEDLPLNLKFSFYYEPYRMIHPPSLYIDLDALNGEDVSLKTGLEFWFNEAIGLRFGYRSNVKEGTVVTGFGARGQLFQIDYSYSFSSKLATTHRVSATFRFGGINRENSFNKSLEKYRGYYRTNTEFSKFKQNKKIKKFKLDERELKTKTVLFPPPKTIK